MARRNFLQVGHGVFSKKQMDLVVQLKFFHNYLSLLMMIYLHSRKISSSSSRVSFLQQPAVRLQESAMAL